MKRKKRIRKRGLLANDLIFASVHRLIAGSRKGHEPLSKEPAPNPLNKINYLFKSFGYGGLRGSRQRRRRGMGPCALKGIHFLRGRAPLGRNEYKCKKQASPASPFLSQPFFNKRAKRSFKFLYTDYGHISIHSRIFPSPQMFLK